MHVTDAALSYAKIGFKVFPAHAINDTECTCPKGLNCVDPGKHPIEKGWMKKASTDPDIIKKAFTKYQFANIGIATGKDSNLTVLDVDGEAGHETFEGLNLPDTPRVITGSGGLHLYFRFTDIKNAVKFASGLDIRSEGGLVIAPPSAHISGKPYAWDVDHHIDDISLAKFPNFLIKEVKKAEKKKLKIMAEGGVGSGSRNDYLTSIGGSLRNRGASETTLCASLLAINKEECSPPLGESEVRLIAKKLMSYQPKLTDKKEKTEDFEPIHIADFFLYQNKLVVKKWRKEFYIYKENFYEKVGDDYFESMLQSWMKKDIRFIKYIGKNKVQQTIKCFNQLEYIISDEFDMNIRPGLVPLQNGVFSIEDFLADKDPITKHSPDFLCTYCLPFKFDPKAKCKVFDKIRIDILGNKKNASVWDEVLGYHIFQQSKLENFFILYGEGGNGKTVLLTILSSLLGEKNVSSVSLESLTSQSFALSETLGKLANIIPELPHIDRANEAIIKAFVTKEIMTFDRKWKPAISTRPTAVLTMATNTLPQFQDKSDGLWRRMILFEISYTVSEKKKDRRLIDPEFWNKGGELPGIFNRALEGLRRISVRGKIDETDAMRKRKQEYREELNSILRFLKENCKQTPGKYTPTSWAYACYKVMMKNEGHRYPQTQTSFVRQASIEIERHELGFPLSEKKIRVDKYVGRAFENMEIDEFTMRRANLP